MLLFRLPLPRGGVWRGCGEGVSPSPPEMGSGKGAMPAPPQNFFCFDIKMVGFRAFWWYYFAHVYIWGPITKSK